MESIKLSCVVLAWDWLSLVGFFFSTPPPESSLAGIKREVAAEKARPSGIEGGGGVGPERACVGGTAAPVRS